MNATAASIAAAVAASTCCIGPVVLVLLVAGAFRASLASLERYRPVFLVMTAAFPGVAFYAAYRPIEDCGVSSPRSRRAEAEDHQRDHDHVAHSIHIVSISTETYGALKKRGVAYAIRMPANESLEWEIAELLF